MSSVQSKKAATMKPTQNTCGPSIWMLPEMNFRKIKQFVVEDISDDEDHDYRSESKNKRTASKSSSSKKEQSQRRY